MPPSNRDHLAKLILAHCPVTLPEGTITCSCKRPLTTDGTYAAHLAEMVLDGLDGVIAQERIEGQLSLLAGMTRYFGPGDRGATTRSRTVYTGAQFAAWCREKALALHRTGRSKPPTLDRTAS